MAENESDWSIGALLLGIGAGLALGFLFAPQSGEETREVIAGRAREGMAYAADAIDELKVQVETSLASAGEAIQQLRARAEDAAAEARGKLQEAVRVGQNAYQSELRERQAELESHPLRSAKTAS
jgi:gas vesicle protein